MMAKDIVVFLHLQSFLTYAKSRLASLAIKLSRPHQNGSQSNTSGCRHSWPGVDTASMQDRFTSTTVLTGQMEALHTTLWSVYNTLPGLCRPSFKRQLLSEQIDGLNCLRLHGHTGFTLGLEHQGIYQHLLVISRAASTST